MSRKYATTLLFIIFSLVEVSYGLQNNSEYSKLNISIYFESLCPDSHNFIINQLYPNWNNFKDSININFIPFGKSSSLDDGNKFICQHGPNECKGNKILSCALTRIADQTLQVEYVKCFMETFKYVVINPEENGQMCSSIAGLNINDEIIQNCYNSNEGQQLQLNAETETKLIDPKFVPTLVFNNVFNQEIQENGISNFKSTVCKSMPLITNCNNDEKLN